MSLAEYAVSDRVAAITMDDGKVNALSPDMLGAINDALDRAEKDDVVAVVLAGRPGRFCAGFDLSVLRGGGEGAEGMLRAGFELSERLLGFPRPVVLACTGHAIAMGSFLLLSTDYRVGAAGDFRIQANEVAIGLTMPYAMLAVARYRLTPPAFDRAVGVSSVFTPSDAVTAGWLDEIVEPDAVVPTAMATAKSFEGLDLTAHAGSKLRARGAMLEELRRGIESLA